MLSTSSLKSAAALSFSIVCYLSFVAAMSYLVGFLVNLTPKGIDGGGAADAPFRQALGIDLLLIALFGLQHSIMAREGFKRRWSRLVPASLERSVFVLCSSLALGLLFWQWRPLPAVIWHFPQLAAPLHALFALGVLIQAAGSFHLDHAELFGLKQVWRHVRGRPAEPSAFRSPGMYRFVRHPIYFGALLMFWAAPLMSAGHLVLASGMTLYLLIGMALEERSLLAAFGSRYARYSEHTPMLLPGLRWSRRNRAGRRG